MKKTIIVLIALAVAVIFYWQFFKPAPSPAAAVGYTPSAGQSYWPSLVNK